MGLRQQYTQIKDYYCGSGPQRGNSEWHDPNFADSQTESMHHQNLLNQHHSRF